MLAQWLRGGGGCCALLKVPLAAGGDLRARHDGTCTGTEAASVLRCAPPFRKADGAMMTFWPSGAELLGQLLESHLSSGETSQSSWRKQAYEAEKTATAHNGIHRAAPRVMTAIDRKGPRESSDGEIPLPTLSEIRPKLAGDRRERVGMSENGEIQRVSHSHDK